MSLSNSPSLDDYKHGIPDKPRDPVSHRKGFRIILLGLLVIVAGMGLYNFLHTEAASLLAGQGALTGQVVDQQGMPLKAQVFVMGVDRPVQAGADGSFTYTNIPAGERSLVIIFNGTASEYPVQVQAGTTVNVGKVTFTVVTPTP